VPRGQVSRRIRFTDRTVRGIKSPPAPQQVDYYDESLPGFGLRASYNGRKSWMVLYRCGGVKGRLTFGRVDLMPLVEARELAREALKEAASGKNPATRKKEERGALTFKGLVDRFIAEYAKPKKRSWKKDQRLLTRNLVPELGRKKALDVTRAELRAELAKIKQRPAPIEANRTFEVVRKVYNWAIEEEILTANPADRLTKPAEEPRRERTLTPDEIQSFWRALEPVSATVRGVLRLMLLGVQRRNEVTHMRWQDLDRRENWWNIPAEFTKTKRPYRVALTAPMLAVIAEMEALKLDPIWVFPRARGAGPVPETNISRPFRKIIKDAGLAHFMAHDLLHTATSHMTAMGISEFDVGKVRHHTFRDSKTSTGRYNHYQYDREKRQALDAWASRLEQIVTGRKAEERNVVPLRPI
jgi:integrase